MEIKFGILKVGEKFIVNGNTYNRIEDSYDSNTNIAFNAINLFTGTVKRFEDDVLVEIDFYTEK